MCAPSGKLGQGLQCGEQSIGLRGLALLCDTSPRQGIVLVHEITQRKWRLRGRGEKRMATAVTWVGGV